MQWLIDLIIEAIGIPPTFINRGVFLAYDWTEPFFIKDDAWHDLDVSSIVPSNATAVLLQVNPSHTALGRRILFKRKSAAGNLNLGVCNCPLANRAYGQDIVIPHDSTGLLEYRVSIGPWNLLNVGVKGWWL